MKIRLSEQKDVFIPINNPLNFHLLKDNRSEDEKFSRIDKYFVNHYYRVGAEYVCEKIFYPSQFGIEEIEILKKENKNHSFIDLWKNLKETGKGLYGERPTARIHKPVKRIELECKPMRMRLQCTD